MFHPQYGYDPRLWQGLQPGQVFPQPNFPNPQMGPNSGFIPNMSINNVRWGIPPMNPTMEQRFPSQFGPNNIPQQPQPPCTGGGLLNSPPSRQPIPNQQPIPGQVNNATVFNNQAPIYNTPGMPSTPMLSQVNTSTFPSNPSFPGHSLSNNQPLPGQSLLSNQPLPGHPPLPGPVNAFSGQISNSKLLHGNGSSRQIPPLPPLPPIPPPITKRPPGPPVSSPLPPGYPPSTLVNWNTTHRSTQKSKEFTMSVKTLIKRVSKDLDCSRRDTKTHDPASKTHQSSNPVHKSRQDQDYPRKRKNSQIPDSSRHSGKRSRYVSKSSGRKTSDHKLNCKSGETSLRDRNLRKSELRTSHTARNVDNKHSPTKLTNDFKQATDSLSSSCETARRDLPLRSVSPPAPDIKRRIKFIVPEDLYQLTRQGTPPRTIVTATKELQTIYQTFENKVLNPPNKVETTPVKDLPGLDKSLMNTKDSTDRIGEDNFDLDSLDWSEFDDAEKKAKGEYSADAFADNDDSEDSGEDENNGHIADSSSSDDEGSLNTDTTVREYRQRKLSDPRRLHQDLWFNEAGEGNDGPVCKCCVKDKEHGIRHAVYPGEKDVPLCDPLSNNANKLHHYWVTVTPHCNFMTDRPSAIKHRDKDYLFEGFSLISHEPLDWIPTCSFIRFNIEYTIHLVKEPLPKNFCVKGSELFSKFLFSNILELWDWTLKGPDKHGCPIFHFIPRFILRQNDKQDGNEIHELLSMDKVLYHLIKSSSEFVIKPRHLTMPRQKERPFAKAHYNNIVTQPHKKPAAFRIDDIIFDSENKHNGKKAYPLILHHGIRPVQMSYAGNHKYQKLWKSYVRLRNTLANKPVACRKDHDKLVELKIGLEKMKLNSSMRRDVEVRMSSQGLRKTGINSDVCQHAMVLPVLVHHLRYHMCLKTLDNNLGYTFKDRNLLQLALTHPSYHLNFGMNPDQARNTLTNCGVKHPRYGDRKIHKMNTKKKGITQLIRIMANLGKIEENQSMIRHSERLEFLGDAVLEFMCSSHLYFMLPEVSEGDLAMYRSALVQNSHLAILAKSFNLSDYMQYSHGPDLCKEEDLDHAMANCFEAIIGAIFLEGGLQAATDFFTKMAFREEVLRNVWVKKPKHPLQLQQPNGDRHLIPSSPVLQKLQEFEDSTGITFIHIRLLARAFTHPQVGFNNLTLGDYQRMEFLGDSVLQLIVSAYLYQHFPDHHEGHLTLLRSSLVNNRTQADVARQLGMEKYINFGPKEVKKIGEKQLADVLEAFLAALYVDKGLKHVEMFCQVCFYPRVEDNIVNQEWIDSKSQLQQCCLALREEGKHPDLPFYKVLQDSGPSHHKKFQVAVYYKGKRVGTGEGHSMHVAEMTAAKDALASSYFPELARQKHFLDGKHQEKRTRNYEPAKPREKPLEVEKTVQEPSWVEHE